MQNDKYLLTKSIQLLINDNKINNDKYKQKNNNNKRQERQTMKTKI